MTSGQGIHDNLILQQKYVCIYVYVNHCIFLYIRTGREREIEKNNFAKGPSIHASQLHPFTIECLLGIHTAEQTSLYYLPLVMQ